MGPYRSPLFGGEPLAKAFIHESSERPAKSCFDEVRDRPVRAANRRSDSGAGRRPLHRRYQARGRGLCGYRAQPRGARHHQGHRHRRGPQDARRARSLYGRGPRGLRHAQMRRRIQEPRRHRHAQTAPSGAADRQGAFCRRPDRIRGRRDPAAGQGCRRSSGGRYRYAPRRGAPRGRGTRRRPAHSRRSTRQCRARLSLWRQRSGRRGLCEGRARHPAQAHQHPAGGEPARAARRHRRPRSGKRPLHAARSLAGRVRHEGQHGGDPQGRTQAGAHPDRQCRRFVRHEVGAVSRICLRAACRALARPAGEVDRRAFGQLRVRQPRPRSRGHGRTGARRGRHVPRRAPHQPRQCRRLPVAGGADAVDAQCGEERAERLPHAAHRGVDQVRLHQHHARVGLSRRRPA